MSTRYEDCTQLFVEDDGRLELFSPGKTYRIFQADTIPLSMVCLNGQSPAKVAIPKDDKISSALRYARLVEEHHLYFLRNSLSYVQRHNSPF